MICKVCNNESHCPYFICSRCINTSPNLILVLKINLIQEIAISNHLSEQVNTILEESLKCSENSGNSSHRSRYATNNDNDNKYIIDILSYQLKKVKLIKELRKNNKIKQSIQIIEARIDNKRKEVSKMKSSSLLLNKTTSSIDRTIIGVDSLDINHLIEWESKIKEIQSFLSIQQTRKMKELNKWFGIDSSMDKDDLRLFYQPIVTIQALKDSINNINTENDICLLSNNLKICLKYLKLITQIFYISIPYFEEFNEKVGHLEYGVSVLVYYCYIICQRLQLFPYTKKGYVIYKDVRLLLEDYTINEIFYHISRCVMLDQKSTNISEAIEDTVMYSKIEWTLPMIHNYIEKICNDHTNISSRNTVILPRIKQQKEYTSRLLYDEMKNNSNNIISIKHISASHNKDNNNSSEQWKKMQRTVLRTKSKSTPIVTKSSPSIVKIMPTTNLKIKPLVGAKGKEETTIADRWFVVG